jgi:hypothetical protein
MHSVLGLEQVAEHYVAHVVLIMQQLIRVLRDDGAMWLILEDNWGPSWNLLGPDLTCLAIQALGLNISKNIWDKLEVQPRGIAGRKHPVLAHEHLVLCHKHKEDAYYDWAVMLEATAEAARSGETITFAEMTERGTLRAGFELPADGKLRQGRSVIRTRGASDLHPHLVRRLVCSIAPQRGCCSVCGTPRLRAVHVQASFKGPAQADPKMGYPSTPAPIIDSEGWQLNCEHVPQGVKPAVILDPFAGDCTVLREAAAEKMHFIGIDVDATRVVENGDLDDRSGNRLQSERFDLAMNS